VGIPLWDALKCLSWLTEGPTLALGLPFTVTQFQRRAGFELWFTVKGPVTVTPFPECFSVHLFAAAGISRPSVSILFSPSIASSSRVSAWFKFGKAGLDAGSAGIYGSQGREDYDRDDVEHVSHCSMSL